MNDSLARRAGAIALLCLAALASAQEGPQKLAQVRLNAGIHNINAELASTPQQREIGLMFRTAMPANDGMLFAFEQPAQQCFWMRNTLIPLDMIFVRQDGTIARIATAQPLDETTVPSGEPISMVIEIRGGRAAELGIAEGDKVNPPPLCCKP